MGTTRPGVSKIADYLVVGSLAFFVAIIPLLWSSMLASPFFTPKTATVYPAGALLVLGLALRSLKTPVRLDMLDWAIVAFAVAGFAATLGSGSIVASFFGQYGQGTGYGMYLLSCTLLFFGRRMRGSDRQVAVVALVVGAVALTALMWLQQSKTGWAVAHLGTPASGRPGATLGNPVFSGAYVGAGLVAALSLFFRRDHRWAPAWGVAAAICMTGLTLALSRGAWLGAAVAVIVAVALCWRELTAVWPRMVVAVAVVAIFGVAASTIPDVKQSAGFSVGERITSATAASQQSDLGRLGLYRAALHGFIDRPVLGWGPGNFQMAWQRSVDSDALSVSPDTWGADAHSLPLEVLATMGVVGFLALSAVVALVLAELWKRRESMTIEMAAPLLVTVGLGIPLCLNPQSVYLTPLLFLFAGLSIAPQQLSPGRSRRGVAPGIAVVAGAAVLFMMFLTVLSIQADRLLLQGLVSGNSLQAVRGAERFPFYPLNYFTAANALVTAPPPSGQTEDPISLYLKGLRLRPADAYGLQSLAAVYLASSRPQEAADTARDALRVFPLSVRAMLVLARAELALGRADEAKRITREALALTVPSARTYYLAAKTFLEAGDTQGAKTILQKGLARFPGDQALQEVLNQVP